MVEKAQNTKELISLARKDQGKPKHQGKEDQGNFPIFRYFPFFLPLIVRTFRIFRFLAVFCCFSCVCCMPGVDHVPHLLWIEYEETWDDRLCQGWVWVHTTIEMREFLSEQRLSLRLKWAKRIPTVEIPCDAQVCSEESKGSLSLSLSLSQSLCLTLSFLFSLWESRVITYLNYGLMAMNQGLQARSPRTTSHAAVA